VAPPRPRGAASTACSRRGSQRPREIVVVDDASNDAELRRYLRELARDQRITLLEQEETRGYAAAVNRAIALHDDRDVVLLQSDTVVANDWLDRLAYHGEREAKVGAVAPFCNRGAAANYPRLDADNPLPESPAVAALDRQFARANPAAERDAAVLAGPCLYVSARLPGSGRCVRCFAARFRRGVETDFCLRARAWAFIISSPATSTSATRAALLGARAEALATKSDEALAALYPRLSRRALGIAHAVAGRPFARRVDLLRLAEWPVPSSCSLRTAGAAASAGTCKTSLRSCAAVAKC
jgi:glycosyltransferase involved in cell wall biosynthesis